MQKNILLELKMFYDVKKTRYIIINPLLPDFFFVVFRDLV